MRRVLTTVPDLKEMSTAAVSISLLSHIHMPCIRYHLDSTYSWNAYVSPRITKSVEKLPLPNLYMELIKENNSKVCKEITNWIQYHYATVFLSSGSQYELFCLVSYVVWYPNGTINYKQTALNLQSSPRLSDVQKFRLLCTYCLKEEIDQKWSVIFESDAFDRTAFVEYPLIQYWNSYCRNTLDKISVPVGMSLDSYMFQNGEVDNWSAKEYFFDRMNAEEKLENAFSILNIGRFEFQKQMLLKLNETQLIQVYVERPAQVINNFATYDSAEDAASAWFEIRDLINPEQFVAIISKLCESRYNKSFVADVWRSASNEMKLCLLNSDNDPYFKRFWDHCIQYFDIETYKKFFDTNEDIRKLLREKDVFVMNCRQFIRSNKIAELKTLLDFYFPNSEELTQFKHHHIHQRSWFRDICQDLSGKYTVVTDIEPLERILDFCFCDREEVIRFGKDFVNQDFFYYQCQWFIECGRMSSLNRLLNALLPEAEDRYQFKQLFTNRDWFSDGCKCLISNRGWSTLNEMLNLFLPRTEDLFQFKQAFAEKIYTMSFFKTSVLTDQKLRCASPSHLLQELIDLFPCPADKFARLKMRITREKFFFEYCRNSISNMNLEEMQKELQFFFDTTKQCASFRKKLINSPSFFDNCKKIVSNCDFSVSKMETLMDLITFDSTFVIFSADRKSIDEFKKATIFSSPCISILRVLVESNRFKEVKKLFNGFLVFETDKKALRLKLFNKPDQLVAKFFFDYDESTCKSWMECWFSDEKSLQNCKREISVDIIFEEGFKKCVFQTYDESGRVSHCTMNKDFEFGALDRFLKWRFDSAKEVKEYKLRRIDKYESIDTIKALVERGCHSSYFKKLTEFFFENDAVEIAKFKKKHKGERIAEMVKKVRVSYFKH